MQKKRLLQAATAAMCLALIVVMLGAFTRLSDAGLGCPDWPGCYGHLVLPKDQIKLQQAQLSFPQTLIEPKKAWTEMAHRYAAGTLGLLIFAIGFVTLYQRCKRVKLPWHTPVILFFLVIFQALLGMWTVTLKLLPVVVMSHLLGGILIFAFLGRLCCQYKWTQQNINPQFKWGLRIAGIIVFVQIALGGWVSSNYAGIACVGFPTCNGVWIPNLHFTQGFNLFSPVGANYQGGLLDSSIRETIQFIHRMGAVVAFLYLMGLSIIILIKSHSVYLKKYALIFIVLVSLQCVLGVVNVLYLLPIFIAVAHNGVAAILLASIFCALHFTRVRLP